MPPITRAQAKHKFPDFLPEASRDASPFALKQPHRTGQNTKLVDWIILNPGTAEYQSLTEILATWASERSVQISLIDLSQTLGAAFGDGVFQTQYIGPMEYYELMAVYFPEDLTDSHIKKLNRTNPFNLGNVIGSDIYPLAGLTDWQHGWLDRPVLYQGQRTRCLIYFLRWENSDREHEYKNFRVTFNGKIIDHWEEFMTPLRQNRMLGYESQHASFIRQPLGSVLGD
ncbi:similar to An09g00200 [Aspergillus luchuensis]|uniref:Similar to An09g00200 n=1 Tax=Aspergillus kawachii TaxID=1069201 RepID=A0A146F9J9_ASPKA|nr:similar to An09g00200 [Aspergillus luchuensis]